MPDRTEIVVYTTPEKIEHKSAALARAFWYFRRPPKQMDQIRRIWFAAKGRVVASAPCQLDEVPPYLNGVGDRIEEPDAEEGLSWGTWEVEAVDDGPECKPFRGFRYRWWEEGEDV